MSSKAMPHSLGKARDIHSLPLSNSTMLDLPRTRSGSFASSADCRLPGSSGHQSSLSERYGLHALPSAGVGDGRTTPASGHRRAALAGWSTTDRPTTAYGMKRPSTKSTLSRGADFISPFERVALVNITAWPLYLQKWKRVRSLTLIEHPMAKRIATHRTSSMVETNKWREPVVPTPR